MNILYFTAGYIYGLLDVKKLLNIVDDHKKEVLPIGPLSIIYKIIDPKFIGEESIIMLPICFAALIVVPPIYGGLSIWMLGD